MADPNPLPSSIWRGVSIQVQDDLLQRGLTNNGHFARRKGTMANTPNVRRLACEDPAHFVLARLVLAIEQEYPGDKEAEMCITPTQWEHMVHLADKVINGRGRPGTSDK